MSSIIDTLITDRAPADAAALRALAALGWDNMSPEQQAAWSGDSRGAYNASDLNRVGAACAYLYGLLAACGYAVPGYTALRTDWAEGDIPTQTEMTAYLGSVTAIRTTLATAQALPDSMTGLTTEGANDIERLLITGEQQIISMGRVYLRAGMPWALAGNTMIHTIN